MDSNRINILNESTRMLGKLQLLSAYFGEEAVYKIYMRSQVVHKLFESNPELDINKLELFHVQFTASVIDLLKKIKLSNEKNAGLLYDEIDLNKDMIERLADAGYNERNYNLDRQRQSLKMKRSLQSLFALLSGTSTETLLSRNLNGFSSRYAADFFYPVSPDLFNELITYKPADVYPGEQATIQRKLMGLLCRHEFQVEFYSGLVAGTQVLELYSITGEDKHFLYFPSGHLFLLCDMAKLNGVSMVNGNTKKQDLAAELKDKNDKLQSSVGAVKTSMPAAIKTLLTENYKKIEDINFLAAMSNFDVQANILKTMLNTDII